jgi:hypothetical protein
MLDGWTRLPSSRRGCDASGHDGPRQRGDPGAPPGRVRHARRSVQPAETTSGLPATSTASPSAGARQAQRLRGGRFQGGQPPDPRPGGDAHRLLARRAGWSEPASDHSRTRLRFRPGISFRRGARSWQAQPATDAVVSRTPIRSGARRTGRRKSRPNDDPVWLVRLCVEDLRAAVGAEMEDVLLSVRLVGDSHVIAEPTDDVHLIRCERRLHPEGTSCATLAGKTVTHGDHKRIARHVQTKLPTVTADRALIELRPSALLAPTRRDGSTGGLERRG